ncbi:MAG: MotA/TolQ/ExbB proton channel family protein [Acidobacteria bacterium]|nr:MotA/TolQ/ExbB proton channel family protein [Acidobacteriota bacterium]
MNPPVILLLEAGLLDLLRHASPAAQAILVLLLAISVASWAIIINKRNELRRVGSENAEFLRLLRSSENFEFVEPLSDKWASSPLAGIFKTGCLEIRRLFGIAAGEAIVLSDPRQLAFAERILRRAAMSEMRRLESALGWLASTATASPFIGLFGTVVGIIVAFQGLSTQSQTSIQAVAPGIAEALVATAAGIFAAVPAYVAYNYFMSRMKAVGSEMDDFVLEMLNVLERRTMEHGVYRS